MGRLGDDAPRPGTVMVHLSYTAAQLFAVVCPIWLPVVALVTPVGYPLIVAQVCIVLVKRKALCTGHLLLLTRIAERN